VKKFLISGSEISAARRAGVSRDSAGAPLSDGRLAVLLWAARGPRSKWTASRFLELFDAGKVQAQQISPFGDYEIEIPEIEF
jgi:hypothetical protein